MDFSEEPHGSVPMWTRYQRLDLLCRGRCVWLAMPLYGKMSQVRNALHNTTQVHTWRSRYGSDLRPAPLKITPPTSHLSGDSIRSRGSRSPLPLPKKFKNLASPKIVSLQGQVASRDPRLPLPLGPDPGSARGRRCPGAALIGLARELRRITWG